MAEATEATIEVSKMEMIMNRIKDRLDPQRVEMREGEELIEKLINTTKDLLPSLKADLVVRKGRLNSQIKEVIEQEGWRTEQNAELRKLNRFLYHTIDVYPPSDNDPLFEMDPRVSLSAQDMVRDFADQIKRKQVNGGDVVLSRKVMFASGFSVRVPGIGRHRDKVYSPNRNENFAQELVRDFITNLFDEPLTLSGEGNPYDKTPSTETMLLKIPPEIDVKKKDPRRDVIDTILASLPKPIGTMSSFKEIDALSKTGKQPRQKENSVVSVHQEGNVFAALKYSPDDIRRHPESAYPESISLHFEK